MKYEPEADLVKQEPEPDLVKYEPESESDDYDNRFKAEVIEEDPLAGF